MDASLSEESLRALPYAELKKIAKIHGIKANMKVKSIISALLSANPELEDSFLSNESKILNSSKKNKEEMFNKDKIEAKSETPWRETYTVENPVIVERNEVIGESASPELCEANVTFSRGSERKLRSRKVSFVTPVKTPRRSFASPKYRKSLKDRPKTPIASRTSAGKRVSIASPHRSPSVAGKSLPSTPHPMHAQKKAKMSEDTVSADVPVQNSPAIEAKISRGRRASLRQLNSTPLRKSVASPLINSIKKAATEQSNRLFAPTVILNDCIKENDNEVGTKKTPAPLSGKRKRTATPKHSSSRLGAVTPHSGKVRGIKTPNFKAIHQKAFDKMESIEEYLKRKVANSAKKAALLKPIPPKSKLPVKKKGFSVKNAPKNLKAASSGIPFVPSVTCLKKINLNFSGKPEPTVKVFEPPKKTVSSARKQDTSKVSRPAPLSQENTKKPLKRNLKFDLQASLSKKLPYKPHTGPLKPLVDSNLNNTMNSPQCFHQPIKAVQRRDKSREIIRGVRTNRRFELQMSKRLVA